jgi:hypothetical protein
VRRSAFASVLLAGVLAAAATGCSGSSHQASATTQATTSTITRSHTSPPPPSGHTIFRSILPIAKRRGLVVMREFAVGPIASSRRYLAWEATREEEGVGALLVKDLRTGRVRQLSLDPDPVYGLAMSSKTIVYASGQGDQTELVAVNADGSKRRILTRSLTAPVDARGNEVAWAERHGTQGRVVVLNLKTGKQRVAMTVGCVDCYRIDKVFVANAGVVFDLGATSQGSPSLIVQRAFAAAKPTTRKVPNDQQPDLVPSSAGALYYWLEHGWMRWDFGQSRPEPLAGFRATSPSPLAEEQGSLLLLSGPRCGQRVAARLPDGRTLRLPAPRSTPASPTAFGRLCRTLSGFSWTGRRLFLAWSLIPKVSLQGHSEVGVSGMITAANVPSH